ncbi:MAG: HEAT repeat domain-containing protein [Proteobacteria bacterium]|nr:HEAT repeat domain-containing protein [Pseudomonadota bacterium]
MGARRDALLNGLKDPAPEVRSAAARALDRLDALKGLPKALGRLGEKSRGEWVALLRALTGTRDETCLKLALKALAHPAVDVRLAALDLAADFHDWRATGHVARLLKDDSPLVRGRAAEVLGGLGDRRVAEQVSSLLADPHPQVLARAVQALGLLGHQAAADSLAPLAAHADAGVRAASFEALGRLGLTSHT